MLSSFDRTTNELVDYAVALAVGLQLKEKPKKMPVVVINEPDDFFGNSVSVVIL